jgi:DNA invertase Pin-like site-specific DNA recombinase
VLSTPSTMTAAILAARWSGPASSACWPTSKPGRSTRSSSIRWTGSHVALADFAKMVEAFDARGVSFVSVTQQFNTTSSMGRLTLNVFLSFAQFEREVTGERIRDKIAASKRKGMWMGGMVPLGYDLKDHHLIINEKEAEHVREIFRLYLELGCVKKLKAHLDRRGVKSKIRISRSNRSTGGTAYSRGALYKILQNRIYLGEIPHKGQSYPGEHLPIVDRELWERVRALMSENVRSRRHGTNASAPVSFADCSTTKTGTASLLPMRLNAASVTAITCHRESSRMQPRHQRSPAESRRESWRSWS